MWFEGPVKEFAILAKMILMMTILAKMVGAILAALHSPQKEMI